MENAKLILEILTYITTILGLPVAVYIYFKEKKKETDKHRCYLTTYNVYYILNIVM